MTIETIAPEVDETTKEELAQIEKLVTQRVTIPDLIRVGCSVTGQANGWGEHDLACTLSAAGIGANLRGILR